MNTLGMGIGMWIFWIVIIVGGVVLAKLMITDSSKQGGMTSESPLEILEKRFASGEINQNEFESMKKKLGN